MKIVYLFNGRLPTEKAHGIQIAKMCEAFALEGLDVTLTHPFRKNRIKDDIFSYYSVKHNFKTKEIWAPDFYLPGRLDKIAVNVKGIISALLLFFYVISQKADIIYSRDEWPLYFLSFFKNNLFFEAHKFSKHRKLFYNRFKNKNIKVVVITKHLKGDFIKMGFRPENILVAPDSVDLAEFDVNISKEEARIRVGLPSDKKIVMYAGHLFEWKGANTLLEAARQCGDVLFVFVGGTNYDIEKFRKKAEGLDNVLILGHKPHKDIPFFLKAADVLVLPNSAKEKISRFHTSPLKLFEYMASGRPIIASDLPSIREVLNDKNSFLVMPDNPESFASGIKKIIESADFGRALSQKALEDVKKYTWSMRVKNIFNLNN